MAKFAGFLQKIESFQTSSLAKKVFKRDVRKGDLVSIIYYDVDKEEVKLQQFAGKCYCRKHSGVNSIIGVSSIVNKVNIKQKFFLYSRVVLDVSILKKRAKVWWQKKPLWRKTEKKPWKAFWMTNTRKTSLR